MAICFLESEQRPVNRQGAVLCFTVWCFAEEMQHERNTDQPAQDIGDGLRQLNADEPECIRADQQQGEEVHTGAHLREEGGNAGISDALVQHVNGDG